MTSLFQPAPSRSPLSRFLFFALPLLVEARFSLPVLLLTLVFQLCGFSDKVSAQQTAAQQPKAGSNWANVQALPPGTRIDLKARTQHLHCNISSVTDVALNCNGANAKPVTIERPDILSIKIGHRTRSTLVGAGVGGAALGITGFATFTSGRDSWFGKNFLRGQATAAGLLAGGAIGAGVGALTDFSKSTIYKAP